MMPLNSAPRMAQALGAEQQVRLMRRAREVTFPLGTRLFEEGGHADRFWVVRSGSVALDMQLAGRPALVIDRLGSGELVGWSWLFPPYVWQLGAESTSPMSAYEFDAMAVRLMCEDDPGLGKAVGRWVGRVIAHRLCRARTRLLDMYAPHGYGAPG